MKDAKLKKLMSYNITKDLQKYIEAPKYSMRI